MQQIINSFFITHQAYFELNSGTGSLTQVEQLDREALSNSLYRLTVQACDQGSTPRCS